MGAKQLQHILYSSICEALIQAGPRLKPLQQVHAKSIVSGSHHSLAILTKLLTLACAAGQILYTRQLFFSIPTPDSFLYSSLIKSSAKFHFPLHAILFYRYMLISSVFPSTHAFTAVMKACGELQDLGTGRAVHSHALVRGFGVDMYVQGAMISFYGKCGWVGVARMMFDRMLKRTVVAWNSMISAYEQNGFAEEAVALFCRMRDLGVGLDSMTFVSVLSACSQLGDFSLGCWVHEYANVNRFDLDVVLGTSLINMYARCGHVGKAREVFDLMKVKNVVAWTAMISGYGTHGYGREAIELFHLMEDHGLHPNDITFVVVLSACAHAGLVQEARQVFSKMTKDYDLVPGIEHHVCMVDTLGRAGLLNEAFQYINEMKPLKPVPAVWTAILGACKMHKNYDLGLEVADHLLSIEPENPGHYVLLSNIYAMAGRMDRVEMVRNIMIRKGLKKHVGYSTVEFNQKTYLFSTGDRSYPETVAIYNYLNELMQRCKDLGYVPASELVMHELEEEERDSALRYHSEKLALAFGLLKTSNGLTIKIVKNLRMCEDCHTAINFISVIVNREIIVRDKLRFHHFKSGSCSCGDYW